MKQPHQPSPDLPDRQALLAEFAERALQDGDLDRVMEAGCDLLRHGLAARRVTIRPPLHGEIQPDAGAGAAESRPYAMAEAGAHPDRRAPGAAAGGDLECPAMTAMIPLSGGGTYGLVQLEGADPRKLRHDDLCFLRICCAILGQAADRLRDPRAPEATRPSAEGDPPSFRPAERAQGDRLQTRGGHGGDGAEDQLRVLLEGIPQLVWRSAAEGRWSWASLQWLSFTGQTAAQARGLGWLDAVHPDDREPLRQSWREAHRKGELDVEFRIRRATDGAYLWHHTRSRPVHDGAGLIVEWLGTSTEVQALKELQKRQQILVAELQHRTRNLIGVIGSIAAQTMAATGPTRAFLDQFNDRLAALSRVQGLLSRAEQDPITLRALLRMELDAMGAQTGAGARLEGPDVRIRPTIVQTLALALHELATNARKFGALSPQGGQLGVTWRVEQEAGMAHLRIEWRETQITAPDRHEDVAGGYGRLLIEKALPYSLGARTTYELGTDRLLCTIDLPLERDGPDGAVGR